MRRNRRHIKVWLLTFIVSTTTTFAQTLQQRQEISNTYDKSKLNQLQREFTQRQTLQKDQALRLATLNGWEVRKVNLDGSVDELMAVSEDGKPIYFTVFNADAARSTRADHLNIGGSLGLSLDGQNMTAHVWDGGPTRPTHQEFDGPGGNNRVSINDGVTSLNGNSFHAQHVTGTIVASGVQAAAKGMAPQADALTHDWNSDLSEATAEASAGMLISNHSYGYRASLIPDWYFGAYIDESRDWDNLMYNSPYYLMVVAAGNDGNDNSSNASPLAGNSSFDKLSGHSTSKNNMVVANGQDANINGDGSLNSVTINSGSSEGPTDDYRIKPDITGNGTGVYSTYDGSDTQYNSISGTSMASPNVAGTLLLLQQHYNNLNGSFMRSATLKGLALHTADDAGISGPDAVYGWGLMNGKAAAEAISDAGTNAVISELSLSNGGSYSVDVTADGVNPLVASISWTDPAGTANTGTTNLSTAVLVNDLDIRVTQSSSTYSPYRMTGVNSNGTGDNSVDPFERVNISGASGTYTITVTHKGSLSGGGQNFSLVVTGVGTATPPPPVTCVDTYPYSEGFESNDGWTQVGGDDGNWVRDSGGTPSSNTGPSGAIEGSFYMFLEASTNGSTGQIGSNATAILESDCFDLSAISAATFSFQHHMYGSNVGSLTVQGSSDGTNFTNLWTLSGNQGNQWNAEDVSLNSYVGGEVTLRIVGTTGNGWLSDIAVDDLSVTAGGGADTEAPTAPTGLAASNVQETTLSLSWNASSDNVGVTGYDVYMGGSNLGTVTGTSANITGLTATTAYSFNVKAKVAAGNESGFSNTVNVTTAGGGISCSSTASLPYSEGFESNDGWTQVTGDDGDWVRDANGTPSSNTGPSSASEGSYYMFLEASTNGSAGQIGNNATAILESDCFDLSSESSASFSFDYHMYGNNVGSIVAQVSVDGTTWTNVWSLSGNQGNSWQTANIDLASYLGGTIQLRIVGTTGNGWSSDIAVDNLSVSGGSSGGTTTVTLTITLDNYPEETSWQILDGSTVLASGGTYGSQPDGSTVVENIDLATGCYDFVIDDVYGDGICCSYGTGSYSLTDGSTTLASGGAFGASETTNFCVGGATTSYSVSSSSTGLPTSVDIYPNPVVGSYLNVITTREEVSYIITNLNGQQVAVGELKGGKADVSSLSHGLYVINLIDAGGKTVMKKFIKE